MKVLLSAYACDPARGSEPGVGWKWAIEIARRGHQVTVLTRAKNKPPIDFAIKCGLVPSNMTFLWYDLPSVFIAAKRITGATLLYYAAWQIGAYNVARVAHRSIRFDVVHHLTFGSIRNFSLLWRLNTRFVLGPLGGGESSPFWLRWHTGIRGGLFDSWRDLVNFLSVFDPVSRGAQRRAEVIAVTTSETKRLVSDGDRSRTKVVVQIGADWVSNDGAATTDSRHKKLLFVGRFLHWKGMDIGLRAFAIAAQRDPTLRLTMLGHGPSEKRWRRLCNSLSIDDRVTWLSHLSRDELEALYQSHGVFLFPSLHDSGGQVVLEALSRGLPVVCIDVGGPGHIVRQPFGQAVRHEHKDFDRLIEEMAKAILEYCDSAKAWEYSSEHARKAASEYSWPSRVLELGVY